MEADSALVFHVLEGASLAHRLGFVEEAPGGGLALETELQAGGQGLRGLGAGAGGWGLAALLFVGSGLGLGSWGVGGRGVEVAARQVVVVHIAKRIIIQ